MIIVLVFFKFAEIGNIGHISRLLVLPDSFSVFLIHLTYFLVSFIRPFIDKASPILMSNVGWLI